jgi:hypothetical protein
MLIRPRSLLVLFSLSVANAILIYWNRASMSRIVRHYHASKMFRGFAFVLLWRITAESLSLAAAGQSSPPAEALAPLPKGTEAKSPATAGETDFDINKLADRLRASSAIGVFTKLALRNEVDDLLDTFRRFHAGECNLLAELRERFNLLLMKISSLLQDKDPKLSKDIFNAREVLWAKLVDPKEFSKI